ncbi:syndecan-2-like [Toxotes jaculatrix]|uniref:syndecan-2-like n=1 Tax=Toxotes jaculatrix TaxID=941984 RepID=UPI001B3B1284|nr:syndecan-2-like [Toxotes jaculatrix]
MRNLWLLFLVGLATGFISEKLLVSSQSQPSIDDLYLEGQTSGDLPIDDEDGEDDGSGSGSGDYAFVRIEDSEMLERFLNFPRTREMVPAQPQPTADSSHNPPTTAAGSQDQTTTVKTTPYIFPSGEDGDAGEALAIGPTAGIENASPSSSNVTPTGTTATEFSIAKDADEDNSLDRLQTSKESEEKVLIQEGVDNEVLAKNRGKTYAMESSEEVTPENLWERTEVLAAVIACGVVGFLCAVFLLLLLAYRMKKKDEGSYDLGDTKLSTTAYHKAPTKEFYA